MPRKPAPPTRRLPDHLARRFAGKPSHERPSEIRVLADPQPGYFQLRLVRRGPWVPALIWRPCPMILPDHWLDLTPAPEEWCCPTERPRPLRARIGNREVSVAEIWERGQRITSRLYADLMEVRGWAERYAPAQPEANPKKPVDLGALPSLF